MFVTVFKYVTKNLSQINTNLVVLKDGHRYRSKLYLKYFGNIPEYEERPPERRHDGKYVYEMVRTIRVIYGKKKMDGTTRDRSTPPIEGVPFKKQSIFFQYLPYWPQLEVPHAIDSMHVQKNVFESLIATLMDTPKSKDGLKARRDMEQLKVMLELQPVRQDTKAILPSGKNFEYKVVITHQDIRFIHRPFYHPEKFW